MTMGKRVREQMRKKGIKGDSWAAKMREGKGGELGGGRLVGAGLKQEDHYDCDGGNDSGGSCADVWCVNNDAGTSPLHVHIKKER